MFDELDNPNVVSDPNITPARKCGFCMGVSQLFCVELLYTSCVVYCGICANNSSASCLSFDTPIVDGHFKSCKKSVRYD